MNFIVDIGNTAVKFSLFEKKKIIKFKKTNNFCLNQILDFTKNHKIDKTIFSSVKKIQKDTHKFISMYNPLIFDNNTPLPIKIKYLTPETLGVDRIANAVAASCQYQNKKTLIFDFGTCLTIDVVNDNKEFLGGRISPGLIMRYKSLNYYTDLLPLCEIIDDRIFIGNTTNSSINSGVQEGMISEVDSFIDNFRKENKSFNVIFTGGDCFFFEKAVKNSIFANPYLQMEGLNEILDYNE